MNQISGCDAVVTTMNTLPHLLITWRLHQRIQIQSSTFWLMITSSN